MKKLWIVFLAISVFTGLHTAEACSMRPPNLAEEMNALRPLALAAVNIENANVTHVELSKEAAHYIWTDPMCPEGIASQAEFKLTFSPSGERSLVSCQASVLVSRTRPTGLSQKPVKNQFIVDVISQAVCSE